MSQASANAEISEPHFIQGILGLSNFEDGRQSTLLIAIRGVRHLSDRHPDSGIKRSALNFNPDVAWEFNQSAIRLNILILYLIILECIGELFQLKRPYRKPSNEPIIDAIVMFAPNLKLSLMDCKAINNLRNTIAHSFSLANDKYHFTLDAQQISCIGVADNNTENSSKSGEHMNFVSINDRLICDLVEAIFLRVKNEFDAGNIILNQRFNKSVPLAKMKYTVI